MNLVLLITAPIFFIYLLLAQIISHKLKRADFADTIWGFGFFLLAWTSFLISDNRSCIGLAVNLLITIWAIRLSVHLYFRSRMREEDFRYQEMKKNWGRNQFLHSFFKVFLLQGGIAYFLSLPVFWVHTHRFQGSFFLFIAGVGSFFIGFLIESIADYQLLQFLKYKKKGDGIYKDGLWAYSRHPNYLGEIIQWWSIWLICVGFPWGFLFFISPLFLTLLIVYVSGIAPLEKKMKSNEEFIAYKKSTPCLIPYCTLNLMFYFFTWMGIVVLGRGEHDVYLFFLLFVTNFLQIIVFFYRDKKSFSCCIPLMAWGIIFGGVQELILLSFDALSYSHSLYFPPFWVFFVYVSFSLVINSFLSFINKTFIIPLMLGGVMGIFFFFLEQTFSLVAIQKPILIYISWTVFLTLLVLFNRRLLQLYEKFTSNEMIKSKLDVFYDDRCPICAREIQFLQRRIPKESVNFLPLSKKETEIAFQGKITLKEAMHVFHGITSDKRIVKGVSLFALLYAKLGATAVSVLLESPLFKNIFVFLYYVWTKIR